MIVAHRLQDSDDHDEEKVVETEALNQPHPNGTDVVPGDELLVPQVELEQ